MKKGASFFLSLFVSMVVITSTIAPAFAQLATPPVVTPPVVPPPVTPPADTTAPVISGVDTLSVLATTATIVWTTNEAADSNLTYGLTTSYGSQGLLDASLLLAHTATLTGLTPNTTYYYCIQSKDLAGNIASDCGRSFTTASLADTTAPTISDVAEASVISTEATIVWATDESAISTLEYGTTQSYGSHATLSASALLAHTGTILGLTPATTYHYCIHATDLANNTANSCNHSFTTAATISSESATSSIALDTNPPTVSLVTLTSVVTSSATVNWTTNEVANGEVQYGLTASYGQTSPLDTAFSITHSISLSGLTPSTEYHYRVKSSDEIGNQAVTPDNTFTTGALPIVTVTTGPDTTPPAISGISTASVSSIAATITWTTNELAVSTMSYGTSLNYGSVAALPATALLAHTAVLTGLSPNIIYYYCISAVDLAQNRSSACGQSFTTAPAPDTTPPVISGVIQQAAAPYAATIVWTTNELTTSTIRYGTTTNLGSTVLLTESAGLAHSGIIADLVPATTYRYCIDATDLAGNVTSSCGNSFTTAAAPLVADIIPPTVSLIVAAPIATSTATITWTTSELANGQIEYGTSISYGASSSLDTNFGLTRSEVLSNLLPATLYHYRVKSSDEAGNLSASSDQTLTTGALPQVSAQITNSEASSSVSASSVTFSSIEAQSVGTSTVTVAWTTNLPSDSQIEYGDSSLLGHVTTLDTTLTASHSVILTNLSPNTNYYFKVKSKPVGATLATVSSMYDFNTLSVATPSIPPANILSTSASTAGTSTIAISVAADKVVTAQIEYGVTTEYGETSVLDTNSQTSHTLSLTNLVPNTPYQYRVKVVDAADNITYSENAVFTTTAVVSSNGVVAPAAVPDAITTLSVSSHDANSATLTWNAGSANADITNDYDIRYSTSPITEANFANASQDQATLIPYVDLSPNGASRTYLVAGLNPAITYYFALKSKFQNSGYSVLSNTPSVTLSNASIASSASAGSSGGAQPSQSSGGQAVSTGGGGGGGGGFSSGAINAPILLNATPADSEVVFTWKNPNEPSFVRTVIVVKKSGGYPTSPQDGQTIYEGNGQTFTDTSVTNGTTYYYAMYSYDHAKNYSSGVKISLAPQKGLKEVVFDKNPIEVSTSPADHFVETLKKGRQDIEVEHLQEVLAADEALYPEKLITGYFGTLTESALKRFQQKHNLPQTGITDAATQIKLNEVSRSLTKLSVPEDFVLFEHDLQYGTQGDEVQSLQEFLIYEGSYKEALVSGYYGNYTKNAVSIFQKKFGVQPVSGFFGPKTRHKVREITGL